MRSGIQSRLLLTTTLVLGISLTLAALILDRSFRLSTLSGGEEQLRLLTYSVMGAMEIRGNRIQVPEPLPEPRLGQPESGLYAWIGDVDERVLWRSPSAMAGGVQEPPPDDDRQPGEFVFREALGDGDGLLRLSYTVIWEDPFELLLTFHVAADWAPFQAQVASFRRNLYVGVAGVTALFVLAQILAVRWGLRPLRTMALEVREMEEGRRRRLSDAYPVELTGLAENLDRFVAHEERSRSRYRQAMEDLAHSLKTPLAVIRNALERVPDDPRGLLEEQLDRMQSTVTHQLSRASVTGPVIVGRTVDVAVLVERLLRALATAYRDRNIQVDVALPERCCVRGDERDLMEILGNLLENAFKYTSTRVRVSGAIDGGLTIRVEDDGPGIAPAARAAVLNRGTRADEVQPGHGIGLSVVAELVGLYHGRLEIDESRWGGACLELMLPLSATAPA